MQELHCFLSQLRPQKQLSLSKQPKETLSVRKTKMGRLVPIDAPPAAKHLA